MRLNAAIPVTCRLRLSTPGWPTSPAAAPEKTFPWCPLVLLLLLAIFKQGPRNEIKEFEKANYDFHFNVRCSGKLQKLSSVLIIFSSRVLSLWMGIPEIPVVTGLRKEERRKGNARIYRKCGGPRVVVPENPANSRPLPNLLHCPQICPRHFSLSWNLHHTRVQSC